MINNKDITSVEVRGIKLNLNTINRSLTLCARMNFETENLDFIDDIKQDEVFYDLGACEGRFTIYAMLKGIRTYSFEPDSDNFKIFLNNLSLNDLDKNNVFEIALGNKNGSDTLEIGQPWPGGHQKIVKGATKNLRQDIKFTPIKSSSIEIVKLDDFIVKKNIAFPNFIKIDIDGSEEFFLEGANNTIKDSRLKKILFELNTKDQSYQKIIKILTDAGFVEDRKFSIPSEEEIFNILFHKK